MEPTKHHKPYGRSSISRDPNRCAYLRTSGVFSSHQCKHKRHPDTLDGAFCKTHCPDRKKAKRDKKYAEWVAAGAAERSAREAADRRNDLKAEAAALLHGILSGEMTQADPACRDWFVKWAGDE